MGSSNVTLSAAQAAYHIIILTGSLTGNLGLIFPGSIGGRRYIWNQCALNGYNIYALNGASDPGGGVPIPQLGAPIPIILTGTASVNGTCFYDSYQAVPPGVIFPYAGGSKPPGFLFCDGASLATASWPLLFAAIGYAYGGSGSSFTLPDSRGCVLAGADNMGGAYAGRLTGGTLTALLGEQTHTLVTGEIPSHTHTVTDPAHTHGVTDPEHEHSPLSPATNFIVASPSGSFVNTGPGSSYAVPTTTALASTGITINSATTGITNQDTGGGGAHNNVQPTLVVNHIIRF